MSEHEITSRINRNELLGLLHATAMEKDMGTDANDGWDDWEKPQQVTAKMPAVTLDRLLIPDDLPAPPFVIRFRSPAGTNELYPVTDAQDSTCTAPLTLSPSDGSITDDIDPEISTAMSRVTSESLNATISAAIDAAVDELAHVPVDVALTEAIGDEPVEDRRVTAVIARAAQPERLHFLPMLCGFALTFMAGIGLMFLIS